MDQIPPLAVLVSLCAFGVNLVVVIWAASRSQAKNESVAREMLAVERESRTAQFYEAREFARSQAAIAAAKADGAVTKITDVEMRLLQTFQHYPNKTDIRELFNEKLEPVVARLDTVYDELMRRGVQTTALRPSGE